MFIYGWEELIKVNWWIFKNNGLGKSMFFICKFSMN